MQAGAHSGLWSPGSNKQNPWRLSLRFKCQKGDFCGTVKATDYITWNKERSFQARADLEGLKIL